MNSIARHLHHASEYDSKECPWDKIVTSYDPLLAAAAMEGGHGEQAAPKEALPA